MISGVSQIYSQEKRNRRKLPSNRNESQILSRRSKSNQAIKSSHSPLLLPCWIDECIEIAGRDDLLLVASPLKGGGPPPRLRDSRVGVKIRGGGPLGNRLAISQAPCQQGGLAQ